MLLMAFLKSTYWFCKSKYFQIVVKQLLLITGLPRGLMVILWFTIQTMVKFCALAYKWGVLNNLINNFYSKTRIFCETEHYDDTLILFHVFFFNCRREKARKAMLREKREHSLKKFSRSKPTMHDVWTRMQATHRNTIWPAMGER